MIKAIEGIWIDYTYNTLSRNRSQSDNQIQVNLFSELLITWTR